MKLTRKCTGSLNESSGKGLVYQSMLVASKSVRRGNRFRGICLQLLVGLHVVKEQLGLK